MLGEVKPSLTIDRAVNDAELQRVLDAAEQIVATRLNLTTLAATPADWIISAPWAAGELPADLRLAVIELTRHLWQTRRGPTARGQAETAGAAYTLPFRVTQLLAPYELPGFA